MLDDQNTSWTLSFAEISEADLPKVGGKGANLGRLARAGFPVPTGFCVTTEAFKAFVGGCPEAEGLYEALDHLQGSDVEGARRLGEQVREALLRAPLPEGVSGAVLAQWRQAGGGLTHGRCVRARPQKTYRARPSLASRTRTSTSEARTPW